MRSRRDIPDLSMITESMISRYLVTGGWILDGSVGRVATIWHRPEQGSRDAEVLLPRQAEARDYHDRLNDALDSLAEFENRTLNAVVESIVNLAVDLVSVQVVHSDVEGGTIPLEDGVLLNMRSRDLMTAAVLSALSKRRHFSGTRPPEATDYLGRLRLGQTQIGSYVVNIIVPIETLETDQEQMEKTTFSRMVSRNLASGLSALQDAVLTYKLNEDLSVFDTAISNGASANMCDALIGLSGENRTRAFSVSISPSEIDRETEDFSRRFEFTAEDVEIVKAASEYYKDNYVLENKLVRGYVKRLDRLPDVEIGSVTITTDINGAEKNVSFELLLDEYIEAIHAHEGKLLVECAGDIHVSPRAAKLLNASGFRVLRNDDLFSD